MFKQLNNHPLVVVLAILGSLASIGGLAFSFVAHEWPASVDDRPDQAVEAVVLQTDDETHEPDGSDKTEHADKADGSDRRKASPPVVSTAPSPWTAIDTLAGHQHQVTCLAFNKHGERLVSGSLDGTLRVWNFGTGECLRQLRSDNIPHGTHPGVYAVDVRAQDSLIASGHGRVFRLWDIETGRELRSFEDPGRTYSSLAFNPDGSSLALATSKGLQVMDVETRSKRAVSQAQMFSVAFHPNRSQCVTVGYDSVFLWDLRSLDVPRRTISDPRRLACVAYRPNGKQVAAGGRGAVVVWDAATGKAVHRLRSRNESQTLDAVSYSPEGAWLAAGGTGGVVHIWNSETGEEMQTLKIDVTGPGRYVHSLGFNPSGTKIVVGCGDGSIRVWTTSSQQQPQSTS